MKVKTADLTGSALTWAFTLAEGWEPFLMTIEVKDKPPVYFVQCRDRQVSDPLGWAQVGPVLDREVIWLRGPHDATKPDGTVAVRIDYWYAHKNHRHVQNDKDPITAVVRCHIASRLGEYVDIPDELL